MLVFTLFQNYLIKMVFQVIDFSKFRMKIKYPSVRRTIEKAVNVWGLRQQKERQWMRLKNFSINSDSRFWFKLLDSAIFN